MKKIMTLLVASALLMTGCSLIKDAAEVTITTDLTTVIPVVVTGTKSVNAQTVGVGFSQSQDLELADNTEIEPYLEKIREINLKSLVVTVNGLASGQTINTISLDVTGVGTICTQTNITSTANTFTPVITSAILGQVGAKLKSDNKITITVHGDVSGPMTFAVSLVFDSDIVAGALD
jgi:hypothetical protein